jgi:dihydroxyacetone kinase-like protein
MALTVESLRAGTARLAANAPASAPMLNEADGVLGDGDLGVTIENGSRALADAAAGLPDDLGMAFMALAQAMNRAASSSFGTLLATGLMSAAKASKGKTSVPWSEVGDLLDAARAQMQARGRSELGWKTVLDPLDAVAKATKGVGDPAAMLAAARQAIAETLDAYRDKPAQTGRARIFADRSIGLDDPGMLAFRVLVDALTA